MTNEELLAKVQEIVTALEERLNERIRCVEASIDDIDRDFDEAIHDLAGQISELDDKIDDTKTDIENDVELLRGIVNQLESSLADIDQQVTDLANPVD